MQVCQLVAFFFSPIRTLSYFQNLPNLEPAGRVVSRLAASTVRAKEL
jgi:hypothetical protein